MVQGLGLSSPWGRGLGVVASEQGTPTPQHKHHTQNQAVRKLTYLQMMGYDMSWAAFAVVEVMSSTRFAHKRIGYLAACQTFTEGTDVVLLTTNLLKKEFQSPNQYEVGLAVNCLANIVTRDLARDLIGDVVALIGHSKPYVRKKSVLSLYKLYVKYPQGLRLTFDRLKEVRTCA